MESKDLLYKYGHFYDKKTNRRIGLKEGSEIRVIAQSEYFTSFSPVGAYPLKVSDRTQKEFEIRNEDKLSKYKKIYERGAFLYFSISRLKYEKTIIHEFKVELQEELFLYLKSNWKLQEEKLYDCACIVKQNTTNTIDLFEEVYAQSLNEAYKYTYVHYFGNEGNPACNALDRFYDEAGNDKTKISRFRE